MNSIGPVNIDAHRSQVCHNTLRISSQFPQLNSRIHPGFSLTSSHVNPQIGTIYSASEKSHSHLSLISQHNNSRTQISVSLKSRDHGMMTIIQKIRYCIID